MNDASIRSRLDSIEEQIRVLKAEVTPRPRGRKPRNFADLYGIWKGKVNLTFEDIQAAEVKLREDH